MSNKKGGLSLLNLLRENNRETVNVSFLIEIRGRNNILVRGCKNILFYSTGKICLRLHKDILTIIGNNLQINTYYTGAVQVCGRISDLSFEVSQCKVK